MLKFAIATVLVTSLSVGCAAFGEAEGPEDPPADPTTAPAGDPTSGSPTGSMASNPSGGSTGGTSGETLGQTSSALTTYSGFCRVNGNKLTGYCVYPNSGVQGLDTAECPTNALVITLQMNKLRISYDIARPCTFSK